MACRIFDVNIRVHGDLYNRLIRQAAIGYDWESIPSQPVVAWYEVGQIMLVRSSWSFWIKRFRNEKDLADVFRSCDINFKNIYML